MPWKHSQKQQVDYKFFKYIQRTFWRSVDARFLSYYGPWNYASALNWLDWKHDWNRPLLNSKKNWDIVPPQVIFITVIDHVGLRRSRSLKTLVDQHHYFNKADQEPCELQPWSNGFHKMALKKNDCMSFEERKEEFLKKLLLWNQVHGGNVWREVWRWGLSGESSKRFDESLWRNTFQKHLRNWGLKGRKFLNLELLTNA